MALDLVTLWDFDQPALSEQRFREALASANSDDALILHTQIARTYGLRGDYAQAQQILADIAPQVRAASVEVQARHALEYGRSLASATHPAETQTATAQADARAAYLRACELARGAQLDDLAIDALHMLAFVDTAPADQLHWGQQALAILEASQQPAAQRWEASLRNNVGYALHQLGRYDEALAQFTRAIAVRERMGEAEPLRIAHWMVAWTLRTLDRSDEALAIQLRLARECAEIGAPDPYVFEELEQLYRARGDVAQADSYATQRQSLGA